ncbi:phosphatase [Chakrabartyella piscis]|uniref:Ppx/GppA phosphatase family protein n=1 Tax=Chakrabartyella piscis TaxID=2918914 RepID=UPI002958C284|nr:phosphatase [Chakrabartyella piscis]
MYGVIDIGSNTIRLVVYKVEDNEICPMFNKKYAAGLAGYTNKNNCMKQAGIDVAVEALLELRELTHYIMLKELYVFATASLRNIENSAEVVAEIEARTKLSIRLLSGEEEALFDYSGAIQSISEKDGLLVDIGGGSTELVLFQNREVIFAKSIPMGSLNFYNRFVDGIIPDKKEIVKMEEEVKKLLDECKLSKKMTKDLTICGVGGTTRAVKKVLTGMKEKKIGTYSVAELEHMVSEIKDNKKEFYRNILKTSADRVHTFAPGLVILESIAKQYECKNITTSAYGVREGFLYHILTERGIICVGSSSKT